MILRINLPRNKKKYNFNQHVKNTKFIKLIIYKSIKNKLT